MTRCTVCRRRLWPWQRRSTLTPNPAHRMCAVEELLGPTAEARLSSRLNLALIKPPRTNGKDTHHT